MAAALALVSAVLLSQLATSTAMTSPFTDATKLACSDYTEGCTCSAQGMVDNASAHTIVYSNKNAECCKYASPKNCREEYDKNPILCGTDMIFNIAAIAAAAGTTPKTACCKALTATCADVQCTAGRRRSDAAKYKKKANAVGECTSDNDCETKCCEKDMTMCINAATYQCGTNKTKKQMSSCTVSGGQGTVSMTSTATMTVSDEAGFQSTCCEAVPAPSPPTSCPASPSCPTTMEKDSTQTTYSYSQTQCCKVKASACLSLCDNNAVHSTQGSDACGVGGTSVCTSSICASSQVLDKSKVFATGDADAAKKTKCCIAKVTVGPNTRTCSTWLAAAAAELARRGSTSAAQFKGVSMAVSVLVAFMMKFAFKI